MDAELRRRILSIPASALVPSGRAPSTLLLFLRRLHSSSSCDEHPLVFVAINLYSRFIVASLLFPRLAGHSTAALAYPEVINCFFRGMLSSPPPFRPALVLVECRELGRLLRAELDSTTTVRCVRPDSNFNESLPDNPGDEAFDDTVWSSFKGKGAAGRVPLWHTVNDITAETQRLIFPGVVSPCPGAPLSACAFQTCGALRSTEALKICSRCRSASYCCEACQRGAWKEHKAVCHVASKASSKSDG